MSKEKKIGLFEKWNPEAGMVEVTFLNIQKAAGFLAALAYVFVTEFREGVSPPGIRITIAAMLLIYSFAPKLIPQLITQIKSLWPLGKKNLAK